MSALSVVGYLILFLFLFFLIGIHSVFTWLFFLVIIIIVIKKLNKRKKSKKNLLSRTYTENYSTQSNPYIPEEKNLLP